jgi:4-hydroxy-tetrahydrodipicolinate synthase
MTPMFRGTATALVTPFTANDQIDRAALCRLIEFQIDGGVEAILVMGTTGENPTISLDERQVIVETSVACINGRVPLIVGTGTNDTRTSAAYAQTAAAAGADAQLVVGPYYNKPTQAGFVAHVETIAAAADLPIILYNVPGRTSFNIAAETVLTLADSIPSVVGVKEASGDLAQVADILQGRPSGFAVYAGDDELVLPLAALGGDGAVSVISNALPAAFSSFVRVALEGRFVEARELHFRLLRAMRACFVETNPIPIKTVLADMHLLEPQFRLPLMSASSGTCVLLSEVFAPLAAQAA